jgi:hypothetical protein
MVAELDEMQRAVQTLSTEGLPKADRGKARLGCLSAGARLSKLVGLAGGKTKLMARWDDSALNMLNLEILLARDGYSMYCYYGRGSKDANHAKAQRILAGLY